jgi:hypothetical protein
MRNLVLEALVLCLLTYSASSQGHPAAKMPVGTQPATAAAMKEDVIIKKLIGTGAPALVKTPEYGTSDSENMAKPLEWHRILVKFDTKSEMIDELEFRYYAVLKHPKTGAYTLLRGTVTHIDVMKGKQHQSAMYIRPQTLTRYGTVERVAVEIYYKGELIAFESEPADKQPWWRMFSGKTVDGLLLNRQQTPFAFIAYDNYELIKGQSF